MHEEINGLLSAYADDELGSKQRKEVEKHMSVCGECRDEVAQLLELKTLLSSTYEELEMKNSNMEQMVLARIRSESAHEPQSSRGGVAAALAGAMILIAFLWFASSVITKGIHVGVTLTSISFSLIRSAFSVAGALPNLLEIFLVLALIVLLASGWSVRRLLDTKSTG
ncbi:anti-sigma factor family protein [Fictibacillus fluitans]|uniref:Anti-sigma-W factor RsiW n=1 Tax=Fictibacillus fluitans TaxID=3058422 RepID=A0ABT8HUU7_9BACL|nr:zf-HC2 domain-containing protein [Fictibacillus sp. NE201]MDN4524550.1 zf-HC2 domain-containing protein [Fictibacillus sp. NE201]